MELIPKKHAVVVGTLFSFVDGSSPMYTSVFFYLTLNVKAFFVFCLVKTLIVLGVLYWIGVESPT